jgi:hypothetical protein
MLYEHVLGCVFEFLEFRCPRYSGGDLASMPQVCRRWQSAVLSMPSRCFRLNAMELRYEKVVVMTASRFSRHIAYFDGGHTEPRSMPLLTRFMPQLRALHLTIQPCKTFPFDAAHLLFPPQLRDLHLQVYCDQSLRADRVTYAGQALEAMSHQLVHLEKLYFSYSNLDRGTPDEPSFAPLSRCRHLTHLTIQGRTNAPHFSPLQLQQLRTLDQVTTMIFVWGNIVLPSLLAPGHSLQVADLGRVDPPTQADCDALVNLPSLTRLRLKFPELVGPAHIDFVRSLPLLQQLDILFPSGDSEMRPHWPRIGEALAHCARLTKLSLDNFLFTTEQMHDCLEYMPLLADLSLCSWRCSLAIHSLSFLRAGRLSLSLDSLHIRVIGAEWYLRLPFSELVHVEPLRALRVCRVEGILSPFTEEQDLLFEQHVERNTWPLLERFVIEDITIE